MFVGTGSDVGKSVIATAFCRIFLQDGYHPAPFKAQNMSLNSFATPDGLEIGRAQAVQAEAAGIACHTDMNPVLLKPQSDHTSQVILHGKPTGNQNARQYFRSEGREWLCCEVHNAFDRLQQQYNPVVMEGAGSISEINLRHTDIVNMPMAMYAGADVVLVADIDRGGVFASVYGSLMLLPEDERALVKGIIINKFRGDIELFRPGVKMMEDLCHVPVLGVIPYLTDVHIEEEDSMSLESSQCRHASHEPGVINIAVVRLRHMSNFTDFDAIEHLARVHIYYSSTPADLADADIIIIPGSKSTIDDLSRLHSSGMADAIRAASVRSATVLGICGGYQMMGQEVNDPLHIEGDVTQCKGLGLLPVVTTITAEKVTRQVTCEYGSGYEIHQGTTTLTGSAAPLLHLSDGSTDGYKSGRCMGTYLHGILDNLPFVEMLLQPHVTQSVEAAGSIMSYSDFKQQQYDLLAEHVRNNVNMDRIYKFLTAKK